jgi:hypothetical protein
MSLAERRSTQALTTRNCSVEDSEMVDTVGDEDSEVVDTGVDVGDMVDVGDLVGVVEDTVMKKLRNMRRWMLCMVGRRWPKFPTTSNCTRMVVDSAVEGAGMVDMVVDAAATVGVEMVDTAGMADTDVDMAGGVEMAADMGGAGIVKKWVWMMMSSTTITTFDIPLHMFITAMVPAVLKP